MSKKKKILLLADDIRMHSGIATMSREFVIGTVHKYDWVQIGGAVKHPEEGKIVIFDGRLSHKVPPNKCDGRVIVSGNLFFE